MQVIVYTFEDAEGNEFGAYQTQDRGEAEQYARDNSLRCIANTLVFDDREVAWDFTNIEDDDEIDEDEDDGTERDEPFVDDPDSSDDRDIYRD